MLIISSFKNQAIDRGTVAFGEIGLTGEVRPIAHGQERIIEAQKQGFIRAIVPYDNLPRQTLAGIEVIGIRRVSELFALNFT